MERRAICRRCGGRIVWISTMTAPLRNIVAFLAGVLQRDRYLTEVLAALVTFGVGILASFSQDALASRQSLAGLRDMPGAEFYVIAFSLPGIWSALHLWWDGEHREGRVSLAVMLSFVALSAFSLWMGLSNWGFWALFALLLGVMKGYALVLEWSYLRWSVSCLGSLFWIILTLSIAVNSDGPWPLAIAPYAGFAAANLLSVWRARGKRDA
jgi:hypothetical protein